LPSVKRRAAETLEDETLVILLRLSERSGFRLGFQGIHGIFLEKHREQPQDRHIEAERTTAAFMLLVTEVSVGGLATCARCSSN